jgi:hypothetical protein
MSLDIVITDFEEATQTANRHGVRIDAVHLDQVVAGGRRILDDISLTIESGQLVATAGRQRSIAGPARATRG